MTQRLQILAQNNVLGAALRAPHYTALPWPLKIFKPQFPMLQRLIARIIGLGFRPETRTVFPV